jgi:hypothetical protein
LSRIDEALAFLDDLPPDALDGGSDQPLALELPLGLAFDFNGRTVCRGLGAPSVLLPHHDAYAILRSQGVGLGKADYVPHMFAYLRPGLCPVEG